MKTKEIFNLAIKMGIESDLRGEQRVGKVLENKKIKHKKLSLEEKKFFDMEALENPYLDSRIYNINEDKEIKKVLAGIDIETPEMLISKEMGDIDLIIAHHPEGRGLASLADVMEMQCDILNRYGVPINLAEGLLKERISEIGRKVGPENHNRAVDAARILGVNFINVHTPADNLVAKFLKDLIESKDLDTLSDLMNALMEIPEYQEAAKIGAGPSLFVGSPENRCGKIALTELTGGTEGSPKIYEKMANAGLGTVVAMHMSEEHKKEAEAANINVVVAGHISSDSIGMNLFLDELEKRGIEVVPLSGLIRIKRF